MKIDPEALEAACRSWASHNGDDPDDPGDTTLTYPDGRPVWVEYRECAQKVIEAYEAARPDPNPWLSIEEVAKDFYGDHVIMLMAGDPMMVPWDKADGKFKEQFISALSRALSRTIDPPS